MDTPLKSRILQMPEYFLILATAFYWWSSGILWNPVALVLIAILALQCYYRNWLSGILISSIILLICLYMLGALLSELSEFESFNGPAIEMLLVGTLLFITPIFLAAMMMYRYTIHPGGIETKNGQAV